MFFNYHCYRQSTPSLPSPLKGEGLGGGEPDCVTLLFWIRSTNDLDKANKEGLFYIEQKYKKRPYRINFEQRGKT